jgi:hypothetical protein
MIPAPPFPTDRLPDGPGFPAFDRYYEGAKTTVSTARLRFLGVKHLPDAPFWFLGDPRLGWFRVSWRYPLSPRLTVLLRLEGILRPSRVPREPPCVVCPALRPRPGRNARPLRRSAAAPAAFTTKARTTVSWFRGSITRLGHSLSTLRAAVTQRRRKTRFRLVADLYRSGFEPAGFR